MSDRIYKNADGIRRTLITDPDRPYAPVVKTEQVVDEILDGVARDRDTMNTRGPNKLVARVPMIIYERAIHEGWDEDDWKKWLNSSEATPFRIWKGSV
jgi:hypothetical protein